MHTGIQISFTNETGVAHPASFWEYHSFTVQNLHDGADPSTENTVTTFTIRCWHDKAAHDAGDEAIPNLDRSYPLPVGPVDPTPTVGAAIDGLYAYILASDPFFSGATLV